MKKILLLTMILIVFSQHALADYDYDGVPHTDKLDRVKQGIIKGGVYVDGGHGVGPSPYTQSFNVPEYEVKWARLYVGVWGGNELKTGSVAVTFNNQKLETLDLEGEDDTNHNVYCSGHGVYWIVYDVSENQATGPVDAVVTTSGEIDGRVYGVVLVTVYREQGGDSVKYFINEGNVNLHGPDQYGKHGTNNEAVAEFYSAVDIEKSDTARLTTVYLTGTLGENDYLYFNDNKLCDGDNCDDIANSKQYFDFKTFDVLDYIERQSNKVTFELGDEKYVHPVLAVLTVHYKEQENNMSSVSLGADIIPAVSIEVTPDMLNFGTLASGETSSEHTLTINNTGAYTVAVMADVADNADDLYTSGILLNSSIWNTYTAQIEEDASVNPVVVLKVPESYTGVGIKEGTLVFWAQKV